MKRIIYNLNSEKIKKGTKLIVISVSTFGGFTYGLGLLKDIIYLPFKKKVTKITKVYDEDIIKDTHEYYIDQKNKEIEIDYEKELNRRQNYKDNGYKIIKIKNKND